MKRLTCELCGSTDLVKEDGVFVCQSCGTKYSVEEAKKMMIEGTVDVSGSTVKVDDEAELNNLYILARREVKKYRDTEDVENMLAYFTNANDYYKKILVKEPDSWEANFYLEYIKTLNSKNDGATSVNNFGKYVTKTIIPLIKRTVTNKKEQISAVKEVEDTCEECASATADIRVLEYLFNAQQTNGNAMFNCTATAIGLMHNLAESIYREFSDYTELYSTIIKAYKHELTFLKENFKNKYIMWYGKKFNASQRINIVEERIKKINNKAVNAYWEEHKEEKDALLAEKQALKEKIEISEKECDNAVNEIKNEINNIEGRDEVKALNDKIQGLTSQKNSLGMFRGREKKELQAQIDKTYKQVTSLENKISTAENKINHKAEEVYKEYHDSKIKNMQKRITDIDNELYRNR